MFTCPNCGYKQSGGDKCQKCSSLFSYYSQSQNAEYKSSSESRGVSVADSGAAGTGGFVLSWRTAYRIARGVSLALLIIVLVLIFHNAPPPQVTIDSQAAARAAEKIAEAQTAVHQGNPYQVTLDATELNSYLNSNLQLGNAPARSDTTASVIPTANAAANRGTEAEAAAPPSALAAAAEPTAGDVQSAVKDVKVDMVGDLVKAYVVFDFHGKDMSLELEGHLSSEDGYLHFEPTAGKLGSLPLPQSALDSAVDKLMSSPENREKLRLPPGVNSIKVENGQVVIE